MLRRCLTHRSSGGVSLNPLSTKIRSLLSAKQSLTTVARAAEGFDISQPLHPLLCVQALRQLAAEADRVQQQTDSSSRLSLAHIAAAVKSADADGLWSRIVPQLHSLRALEAVQPSLLTLIGLMSANPSRFGIVELRDVVREFLTTEESARLQCADAVMILRAVLVGVDMDSHVEDSDLNDLILSVTRKCKPSFVFLQTAMDLLAYRDVRLGMLTDDARADQGSTTNPAAIAFPSVGHLSQFLDAACGSTMPRPPSSTSATPETSVPPIAVRVRLTSTAGGIDVLRAVAGLSKLLLASADDPQRRPCVSLTFASVALLLQQGLEALQAIEKPDELLFRKPLIHKLHDLVRGLLELEQQQPNLSNLSFSSAEERAQNVQTLQKVLYHCRGLVRKVLELRDTSLGGGGANMSVVGGKSPDDVLRNFAHKSLEPMLAQFYAKTDVSERALNLLKARINESLPHAEGALSASFTHSTTTLVESVRTMCMAGLLLDMPVDLSRIQEAISLIHVKMKSGTQSNTKLRSASPGAAKEEFDGRLWHRLLVLEARCFLHHRLTNFPLRSAEWDLVGVDESTLSHPRASFGTARSLWELTQEEEESGSPWLVVQEPVQLKKFQAGARAAGSGIVLAPTVVLPWSLLAESLQPMRLYDEDKSSQGSFDQLWGSIRRLLTEDAASSSSSPSVYHKIRFLSFEEELALLLDVRGNVDGSS